MIKNETSGSDKTPSFEMTWGSSTSSGYHSQDESDSEFEQYFTARTSFFPKSRKAPVSANVKQVSDWRFKKVELNKACVWMFGARQNRKSARWRGVSVASVKFIYPSVVAVFSKHFLTAICPWVSTFRFIQAAVRFGQRQYVFSPLLKLEDPEVDIL